jgi:hypothetical protein
MPRLTRKRTFPVTVTELAASGAKRWFTCNSVYEVKRGQFATVKEIAQMESVHRLIRNTSGTITSTGIRGKIGGTGFTAA